MDTMTRKRRMAKIPIFQMLLARKKVSKNLDSSKVREGRFQLDKLRGADQKLDQNGWMLRVRVLRRRVGGAKYNNRSVWVEQCLYKMLVEIHLRCH